MSGSPNRQNILAGRSRFFIGVAGVDTFPANTVPFGGSWGGTWRDLGYTTRDGATATMAEEFTPVDTAQEDRPSTYLPNGSNDRVAATLLEATLQNLAVATGRGAVVSVAPSSTAPGQDQLVLTPSSSIKEVALGWEGVAPPLGKGNPRRMLIDRAMPVATVTYNQQRGQATGLPVEFAAIGTGVLTWRDITTV